MDVKAGNTYWPLETSWLTRSGLFQVLMPMAPKYDIFNEVFIFIELLGINIFFKSGFTKIISNSGKDNLPRKIQVLSIQANLYYNTYNSVISASEPDDAELIWSVSSPVTFFTAGADEV